MVDNQNQPIDGNGYSKELYSREVLLKDGRIVQCVTSHAGAVACDWQNSRRGK